MTTIYMLTLIIYKFSIQRGYHPEDVNVMKNLGMYNNDQDNYEEVRQLPRSIGTNFGVGNTGTATNSGAISFGFGFNPFASPAPQQPTQPIPQPPQPQPVQPISQKPQPQPGLTLPAPSQPKAGGIGVNYGVGNTGTAVNSGPISFGFGG